MPSARAWCRIQIAAGVPMHVAEERLVTAVDHLHRTPGPQREQAHVHLQAHVLARPERAAHTGELKAHSFLGQTEALRDLTAILVQPLRRDEQLDAVPVAVGQRERGFEAEEGLVLHADLVGALDHDVADDALVSALDALVAEDVAVGMDRGRLDRSLGIGERLEHLVLDDDRLARAPGSLGMIGSDRGDRLTRIEHGVGREHGLVRADEAVGRAGHVFGGDDHLDAGDAPRGAHVEPADAGMGMRRPQRLPPHHPLGPEVGGEREPSLHLRCRVGTRRARAEHRAIADDPSPKVGRLGVGHDAFRSRAAACTAAKMRP